MARDTANTSDRSGLCHLMRVSNGQFILVVDDKQFSFRKYSRPGLLRLVRRQLELVRYWDMGLELCGRIDLDISSKNTDISSLS